MLSFYLSRGPRKERERGQTAAGGRWDGKLKEELERGGERLKDTSGTNYGLAPFSLEAKD